MLYFLLIILRTLYFIGQVSHLMHQAENRESIVTTLDEIVLLYPLGIHDRGVCKSR